MSIFFRNSNGTPSAGLLSRGPMDFRKPFQRTITKDLAFQQELNESKGAGMLLVVELHSTWCGP